MNIDRILREKEIIVLCGSGGVGKTTTAAALALEASLLGRKTLVLTIDPARRLANALGFEAFDREQREVDPELIRAVGLEPKGQLFAMMLDVGGTFDELIRRHATSPESAEKILVNKLYRNLHATLAGSQEYMAMEKLYDLVETGDYDVIILDTPPSRHALDFLEAPRRLIDFLDEGVLKWFLQPYYTVGRSSIGLLKRGGGVIFSALERISGSDFLRDLSEFFQAFDGMYGGFKERAERVSELLQGSQTIFLLVAAPTRIAVEEAIDFYGKLRGFNLPFSTFVVNRVHPCPMGDLDDDAYRARLESMLGSADPAVKEGLAVAARRVQALGLRDRAAVQRIQAAVEEEEVEYRLVPALDEDVHDLGGLSRIGKAVREADGA